MKNKLQASLMALLCVVAITIYSCNSSPILADYKLSDMTFTVQSDIYDHYQIYYFPVSHTEITAAVNSAGATDLSRVKSTVLKTLTATITSTGNNFDKTSGIEVYLKTSNAPNDSVQVAYGNSFPSGTTTVKLTANGVNLANVLAYDATITVKILAKSGGIDPMTVKLSEGDIQMEIKK